MAVAARAFAQGPERSPVAVLRAPVFEPAPIEAHEVAKPLRVRIPRMLDECGEPGRQRFGQALLARLVERAGHQQRAGIVVDAIAMRAIRHAMDRVLKQPGVVAHGQKMPDAHLRRGAGCRAKARFGRSAKSRRSRCARRPRFERRKIALGDSLPCHASGCSHRRVRAWPGAGQSSVSNAAISRPMAAASPNGTSMPCPSASNSRACQ